MLQVNGPPHSTGQYLRRAQFLRGKRNYPCLVASAHSGTMGFWTARSRACELITSFKTEHRSSPKWILCGGSGEVALGGPRDDVTHGTLHERVHVPAFLSGLSRGSRNLKCQTLFAFSPSPIFRRSATLHTTLHPFKRPAELTKSSLLHGSLHAARRETARRPSLASFPPAASSHSDPPWLSPLKHPDQDIPRGSTRTCDVTGLRGAASRGGGAVEKSLTSSPPWGDAAGHDAIDHHQSLMASVFTSFN